MKNPQNRAKAPKTRYREVQYWYINMIVFWPELREALAQHSVTHAKTSTVSALSTLTLLTCCSSSLFTVVDTTCTRCSVGVRR